MAMTFANLQDSIMFQLGDASGVMEERVKRWLNDARNILWEQVQGDFKIGDDYLTTTAEYESTSAITVTVTNGSTTVTSDGSTPAVFTTGMVGRFVKLNATDPWYKIAARPSATQLTLADAYVGDSDTACAFTINTYLYALPSDFQGLLQVAIEDETNWRSLPVLTRSDVYRDYPVPLRWDTGTPEVCWVDLPVSNVYQLGIFPPPASATLVRFWYTKNATEMSGDSDSVGIPGGDAAVLQAALATAFRYKSRMEEASMAFQQYEIERDRLLATVNRGKQAVYRVKDHTDASQGGGVYINLGAWYPRRR